MCELCDFIRPVFCVPQTRLSGPVVWGSGLGAEQTKIRRRRPEHGGVVGRSRMYCVFSSRGVVVRSPRHASTSDGMGGNGVVSLPSSAEPLSLGKVDNAKVKSRRHSRRRIAK